jgi:hypothetical protein
MFRAGLLRILDFIGSECRRELTTRNIQELGISCIPLMEYYMNLPGTLIATRHSQRK